MQGAIPPPPLPPLLSVTFSLTTAMALDILCRAWLTHGGDEVLEAFLWKERVLQASKVQLEHPRHWVYIVLILVVNQRILTWLRRTLQWRRLTSWKCVLSCFSTVTATGGLHHGTLTSLKWVFNVVDFHVWSRHTKNALLLQACKRKKKSKVKKDAGIKSLRVTLAAISTNPWCHFHKSPFGDTEHRAGNVI